MSDRTKYWMMTVTDRHGNYRTIGWKHLHGCGPSTWLTGKDYDQPNEWSIFWAMEISAEDYRLLSECRK